VRLDFYACLVGSHSRLMCTKAPPCPRCRGPHGSMQCDGSGPRVIRPPAASPVARRPTPSAGGGHQDPAVGWPEHVTPAQRQPDPALAPKVSPIPSPVTEPPRNIPETAGRREFAKETHTSDNMHASLGQPSLPPTPSTSGSMRMDTSTVGWPEAIRPAADGLNGSAAVDQPTSGPSPLSAASLSQSNLDPSKAVITDTCAYCESKSDEPDSQTYFEVRRRPGEGRS
jgi:hypothetical protein